MLKNASWLTLVRVACDLLQFLLFMAFSRYYGPEGIGHYAYALAIAGLVFAFVHLGFEDLAIRDLARLPKEERPAFLGRLLALQMLISIGVCLVLAGFLLVGSHDPSTSMAVLIMSAYYLQYGFTKTLFTPALAQNQMVKPALIELIARLLIIFAAIFLVWQEAVLSVALLPYPLIGLVLVIAAALSARSYLGPVRLAIDWAQARETVRSAWPFGAALLIFTLQVRVSFILLARMLGPEATGIFASSLKFLEFGIFPFVFLALACYPNLSRYHLHRPEDFRRLANRLYLLSLAGGALLTWALLFIAPGLITRLLGESFAASVPVLQSLAILGILMAADIPAGRIMQAARLQQQRASCMLIGVIVTIALVLLLVPRLGIYGAVLANIVGQLVITGLSLSSLQVHAGRMLDRRLELLAGGGLLLAGMSGGLLAALGGELWQSALLSLLVGGGMLAAGGAVVWRSHWRDSHQVPPGASSDTARICFLLESYHPVVGGMETQARTLVEDFVQRGIKVMVVTRRSHAHLPRREVQAGVSIYRLGPVGDGQLLRWALLVTCLPVLLRHHRDYDLLHVLGFRVLGVPALLVAWLFQKKTILRAENNGEFSGEFFAPGLQRLHLRLSLPPLRLLLCLRNRLLRRADRFVSISSQITAELLAGGVPAERIFELPNSVDAGCFHPLSAEEKLRLRQRLGLPLDRPVIAFSGRLVSFKGVPQLLQVWREMLQEGRRGLLLLIGGGGSDLHNCEPQLHAEVRHAGLQEAVHFTGDVRNVHEFLQAADLFAFPTTEEAFGIALIEAMACGLPVVTTQVGGLRDIVRHNENGWVIEAGNRGQLRQALERLLDEPALAARLGQDARATVLQRYERQMIADRYLDVLTVTVAHKASGAAPLPVSATGKGLHGLSEP